MKYSDFKDNYKTNPEKIVRLLENNTRNSLISLYEDYYEGKQWDIRRGGETRITRSGKEEWKMFDDNPARGFKEGELKTWNLIKLMVNIYTKYVRGIHDDDVQINIKDDGKVNSELSGEANAIFGGDLNEWIIDATKIMSVTSVIPTKYNYLEATQSTNGENETAILQTINMEKEKTTNGVVEIISPKEIEPLYWLGKIRGFIRFYIVDKDKAKLLDAMYDKRKGDALYWEVWHITNDGKLEVIKFVEDHQYEQSDGKPYDYIPYNVQANDKKLSKQFDLNNLHESDVADNIDVQDDINAFLTDLNIIYRQVAIPTLKATDDFVKNMKKGDMTKIKEEFSKLNTSIGSILFAPLEKVGAPNTNDSQITYLNDIIDQFYRQTGIPKSVFNSEGMANIAKETLDHLFQSLNVVIGAKRTQLTKIIQRNVKLHLVQNNKWTPKLSIEVYFPDTYGMTKSDIAKMIIDGYTNGLLPKEYAIDKYAEIMGDSEDSEKIKDAVLEEDGALKLQMETKLLNNIQNKQ